MYIESDLDFEPGARVNLWLSELPQSSLPDISSAEVRWTEEIAGAVVLFNFGTGIKYGRAIKHRDLPTLFRIIRGGIHGKKSSN